MVGSASVDAARPLAGKVAIVTGGSTGLGAVMVKTMIKAGAKAVAIARTDLEDAIRDALASNMPALVDVVSSEEVTAPSGNRDKTRKV